MPLAIAVDTKLLGTHQCYFEFNYSSHGLQPKVEGESIKSRRDLRESGKGLKEFESGQETFWEMGHLGASKFQDSSRKEFGISGLELSKNCTKKHKLHKMDARTPF